jgi:hypothetical protein
MHQQSRGHARAEKQCVDQQDDVDENEHDDVPPEAQALAVWQEMAVGLRGARDRRPVIALFDRFGRSSPPRPRGRPTPPHAPAMPQRSASRPVAHMISQWQAHISQVSARRQDHLGRRQLRSRDANPDLTASTSAFFRGHGDERRHDLFHLLPLALGTPDPAGIVILDAKTSFEGAVAFPTTIFVVWHNVPPLANHPRISSKSVFCSIV